MGFLTQFRSFNRPSRLLMINQFGINVGFYMLMPYLADYLAGPLGLAAWAVGLVMGVRNFSQQGMFFVGGTLADRFGYKPMIVAGCLIRTGGFGLLVFAQSLPTVLIASAATGFAGALFNPAVRAYLAVDAGDRKIEAFAMFNIFYQAGILLGPLVGLALLALDFRMTLLGAAAVFAALTVAQLLALPRPSADPEYEKTSIRRGWCTVARNRAFWCFAAAMTGAYLLSFQIYLALPMQASVLAPRNQSLLVAAMFAVSGVVAVAGQLRITRWFAARWSAGRSLVVGAGILAASFVPLAVVPDVERFGTAAAVMALLLSASLLAIASAALFPFEMRTVVALSGDRLVATHYGFYSTIVGVGILLGNLGVGSLWGTVHRVNSDAVWGGLILVGLATVAGLYALDRSSQAAPRPASLRALPGSDITIDSRSDNDPVRTSRRLVDAAQPAVMKSAKVTDFGPQIGQPEARRRPGGAARWISEHYHPRSLRRECMRVLGRSRCYGPRRPGTNWLTTCTALPRPWVRSFRR